MRVAAMVAGQSYPLQCTHFYYVSNTSIVVADKGKKIDSAKDNI